MKLKLLSLLFVGLFASSLSSATQEALAQKKQLDFTTSKSGVFADETVTASIAFALDVADRDFPGWREYEGELESVTEITSVNNTRTPDAVSGILARGNDEGSPAWWGLSVNYKLDSLKVGWTVCIEINKGAYTGKVTFTFAPFMAYGKFVLVSYVREFNPQKLIVAYTQNEANFQAQQNQTEPSTQA